jgi:hypothetical protein
VKKKEAEKPLLYNYLYPTMFLFTEQPPAAVPLYVVQAPKIRAEAMTNTKR